MIDDLRSAAEALNRGDPDPFASLFAEDAEWRGVPRKFLWWNIAPRCHGPEEARAVLSHQIRKRNGQTIERPPEFTQVGDKIVGTLDWMNVDGTRQTRYHVLTVNDGKIVGMRCYGSRLDAERFMRGSPGTFRSTP